MDVLGKVLPEECVNTTEIERILAKEMGVSSGKRKVCMESW